MAAWYIIFVVPGFRYKLKCESIFLGMIDPPL